MLYLASKSDMSFWDGALSPLILTLSWKQTFHVCKENEEEEDEGSPDFQDVACILSCMMAAAQDYRVWGGGGILFSSILVFPSLTVHSWEEYRHATSGTICTKNDMEKDEKQQKERRELRERHAALFCFLHLRNPLLQIWNLIDF